MSRRLIAGSEREALTDTVTTLANRRALMLDLEATLTAPAHVLAIFDLDGFKHYNDTFGHPAGDLLLIRLSERLRDAAAEHGAAPTAWAATSSASSGRRSPARALSGWSRGATRR